jgi:hypothetical protein
MIAISLTAKDGKLRLDRVVALDRGLVIHPDLVAACR